MQRKWGGFWTARPIPLRALGRDIHMHEREAALKIGGLGWEAPDRTGQDRTRQNKSTLSDTHSPVVSVQVPMANKVLRTSYIVHNPLEGSVHV